MCLYPKMIENPKFKPNQKNGWVAPSVPDVRVKYVPIGCQKCIECKKKKSREWQVRMLEDLTEHKNGKFITLTFSNEQYAEVYQKVIDKIEERIDLLQHTPVYTREIAKEVTKLKAKKTGYDLDNEIATYALRHFLENWRRKFKRPLRHWLVTELGHDGTENIHLHGIIWIDHTITHTKGRGKKKKTVQLKSLDEIERLWKYGYVWKGKKQQGQIELLNYVNERTINYIVKYVSKMDLKHSYYSPIVLTSPGIGKCYTKTYAFKKNKYNGTQTIETYRTRSGHKVALPIYWRNKIYTDEQKEKLWIQKLDKEERWICGERVSVKNGDETKYYNLLDWYRKKNARLNYGDNEGGWQRKEYELERRAILQHQRLQNAA